MQWFRVFYFIILRILSELYDIIVRESFLSLGPCFSFIPLIAILTTFFSPLEPSSPSSRSEFWLWGPFWIQLDHPGPLELDQVNMCAHSTSVQSGRIMLDVVIKKQTDVRCGLGQKDFKLLLFKAKKAPLQLGSTLSTALTQGLEEWWTVVSRTQHTTSTTSCELVCFFLQTSMVCTLTPPWTHWNSLLE